MPISNKPALNAHTAFSWSEAMETPLEALTPSHLARMAKHDLKNLLLKYVEPKLVSCQQAKIAKVYRPDNPNVKMTKWKERVDMLGALKSHIHSFWNQETRACATRKALPMKKLVVKKAKKKA